MAQSNEPYRPYNYNFWIGFEYLHSITSFKTYFKQNSISLFDVKEGYYPTIYYRIPVKYCPLIKTGYIFFDKNKGNNETHTYHAIPLELYNGLYLTRTRFIHLAAIFGGYSFSEKFTNNHGTSSYSNSLLFGYTFEIMINYPYDIGDVVHFGYGKIGPHLFRTLSFYLPLDPFFKTKNQNAGKDPQFKRI